MIAAADLPELPPGSPADSIERLSALTDLLAADASAPSSVRDRRKVWKVHIADALSGFAAPPLAAAARMRDSQQPARGARICDVGAGAGLPGLVLAVVLPLVHVDLLEATSRKCEFIARAVGVAGANNASVVCERAETWAAEERPGGSRKAQPSEARESYDVVTARAVGRLEMLAELASPLLREGAALVAWKGDRDLDEEAELERAGASLAMRTSAVIPVVPYAGSQRRHLHVVEKTGPTPARLPRRPGMAKKRPLSRA